MIFISILVEVYSNILYTDRAIISFVVLVRYRFYNDKTLRYIIAALTRINLLKEIFRIYRSIDSITNKNYFNFPKFYNISYLFKIIRLLSLSNKYII